MKIIYLSPHYDDAVLSCGGLICEQVQAGNEVEVWTIFGGDPPLGELSMFAQVLHHRWGIPNDSVQIRRDEDIKALEILGAGYMHLNFHDCIYRRDPETGDFLYEDMEIITGNEPIKELELLVEIKLQLSSLEDNDYIIFAPLGIGNHVDHRIIHKIINELRIDTRYYLDFPYILRISDSDLNTKFDKFLVETTDLDEKCIDRWKNAISAYGSQIDSFWEDEAEMEFEIEKYYEIKGGIQYLRKRK